MKLKHVIIDREDGEVLLSRSLNDIANHFELSLSGVKYRISKGLFIIKKVDIDIKELDKVLYKIDKFGVMTFPDNVGILEYLEKNGFIETSSDNETKD